MAGKKWLPLGRLSSIILEVKERNNFPKYYIINESCIRSRVKKQRTYVIKCHPGKPPSLLKYVTDFLSVLVQMACMRKPISPTEAMDIINSVIAGIQAQKDLIVWKKSYSYGDSGELGVGYWNKFKERNSHLICSK